MLGVESFSNVVGEAVVVDDSFAMGCTVVGGTIVNGGDVAVVGVDGSVVVGGAVVVVSTSVVVGGAAVNTISGSDICNIETTDVSSIKHTK